MVRRVIVENIPVCGRLGRLRDGVGGVGLEKNNFEAGGGRESVA